jgi:hypothetical protein
MRQSTIQHSTIRQSTIWQSTIRYALAWLAIFVMSPGLSWAQTTGLPGMEPIREEPVAFVADLLKSPDAKAQAWGAWYAGRDAMRELTPDLIAVVSQRANGATLVERAARDIALDALIQLRAKVPASLVAGLIENKPAHALILAARIEDASNTLLDYVRANPEGGEEWFAAANLLLSQRKRQPGFARVLVDKLKLGIDVYVSDDGGTSGGSGAGGGIGCGAVTPGDPGLPPWAAYVLTASAKPDVSVLALGPVPIYYERQLFAAGYLPSPSGVFIQGPTSEHRLQYVAALMGISENRLPIRAQATHEIKWTDQPSLDAAIKSFRTNTRRGFAGLVSRLARAGFIPKEEVAAIKPTIDLEVHDVRTNQSIALTPPLVMP